MLTIYSGLEFSVLGFEPPQILLVFVLLFIDLLLFLGLFAVSSNYSKILKFVTLPDLNLKKK